MRAKVVRRIALIAIDVDFILVSWIGINTIGAPSHANRPSPLSRPGLKVDATDCPNRQGNYHLAGAPWGSIRTQVGPKS